MAANKHDKQTCNLDELNVKAILENMTILFSWWELDEKIATTLMAVY